ncbi:hypothetical protein [Gemmatimonas groenlandica]|uniref:Uncharacterized protein n=1 Tax=Gemmatimonas groenlandica TaxID=2732249 RepID=A0A6M4IUQ6_9BACT|nr:hypothetical protein [Gemmatimonas groenlandica]QJR37499.1 hypothetical protein HKW67_19270 [Gemmatimonas groenlandica]
MRSLWRGDEFLGRIHPELPGDGDDTLFGMLDPSAALLPGIAITQQTMRDWPGTPVFQHVDSHAAVRAHAHREEMSDGSMQQRCEDAGVSFSGWCVLVGLATPSREAR